MTAGLVGDLDAVETVDLEQVETVALLEEGEAAPTWPLSASRSRSPKALIRRWRSALQHQVQLHS